MGFGNAVVYCIPVDAAALNWVNISEEQIDHLTFDKKHLNNNKSNNAAVH
jgi:hypothetical protein